MSPRWGLEGALPLFRLISPKARGVAPGYINIAPLGLSVNIVLTGKIRLKSVQTKVWTPAAQTTRNVWPIYFWLGRNHQQGT